MMAKSPIKINKDYCEVLGSVSQVILVPKVLCPFKPLRNHIFNNSVFDVNCVQLDFLRF